ncbi:MAG TPA: hypothetical protein VGL97_11240 [Bryobacteraceae bacterium]
MIETFISVPACLRSMTGNLRSAAADMVGPAEKVQGLVCNAAGTALLTRARFCVTNRAACKSRRAGFPVEGCA